MDHIALIKQLGGAKAVADALTARGIHTAPVTVRSWSLSGRMVPAKYWTALAALAGDKGLTVSFETWAQAAAA